MNRLIVSTAISCVLFIQMLRITVLPNGPFRLNASSGEVIGGFEAGLLQALLMALGHPPHRLLVPEDGVWGLPDTDGRWSGMMGMLQRDQADVAVGSIFVSEARMSVAYFSFPYSWQEVTFATRWPGLREKGAAAFAWPFAPGLWVAVVLAVVVVALAAGRRRRMDEVVLHVLGVILRQPTAVLKVGWRPALLLSWLWGSFFLSSGYTAVLLSFLSVPVRQASVETVPQLAAAVAAGSFTVATAGGSSVVESLLARADPNAHVLGDSIRRKRQFIDMGDEAKLRRYLEKGNTAFVITRDRMRLIFSDRYFLSHDSLFSVPLAVGINRRQLALKPAIDRAVSHINAAGIYPKDIRDKAFHKGLSLRDAEDDGGVKHQLVLGDVWGAFVLLVMGWALGAIVCVGEVLRARHGGREKTVIAREPATDVSERFKC